MEDRLGSKVIEDYAPEGTAEDMWSPYDGTQPNDPAKLGGARQNCRDAESSEGVHRRK
jgi:hypothetical protein